jgi:tetratricopeptide (TPR) repeat protein/DNA-binding XRE family transcriptional regulator
VTGDRARAGPDLGGLLRRFRRSAGLTQEELADGSGLSVRAISDLERGRSTRPYRRSLALIADALGLTGTAREELFRAAGTQPGTPAGPRLPAGPAGGPAPAPEPGPARAPGPGPGPVAVVPRQLPAAQRQFAGRAGELKKLSGMLGDPGGGVDATAIVAISGSAGVGKTTLAVHWAHQVADRFPDGQLYLNLRGFDPSATMVPAGAALRAFLDALHGGRAQLPETAEAQAGLYRSLLASRRCLIVLDNAYDAAQVRPLLPGGPGCLVVVTSRSELTSLIAADGAQLITLGVFSEADAEEMVTRRLDAERVAGEPQAVRELISLCARLPLAVSLAVARAAARPTFPLAALVDELQDAGGRLDALDSADAATSIRAVFSWSYQNLSEPTARMFRLLSEHPGPDITVPAAASLTGAPLSQARTALRELAGSHLLSEPAPGRYAWHDLLRAFASEQARTRDGDAARQAARRRLLDHYLHTCHAIAQLLDPTRDPIPLPAPPAGVQAERLGTYRQGWAWLEAEYQVLLAVIDLAAAGRTSQHAWQLPWAMETYFFRRGHWHDFLAVQRAAVAAALRLEDVPGQASAYHGLGRACAMTGAHTEATEHLSRALRLFQELGTLTGEARCQIDMGLAVARQGSYRDALRHVEQAGQLYRAAGHQAGQAGALNNTGWYQIQLGEYELARANCQQALTMFRQAGSQYGVAHTLDSLGYAYFKLGGYRQAVSCFEQALSTFTETGDHLNQVDTLAHLVEIYLATGNRQAADAARQRALAILEELQYPDAAVLRAKL